jgi:hexosaminidase
VGKNVSYVNPPTHAYVAGGMNALTDGIRGTTVHKKDWHGFANTDMVATIDLGEAKNIHSISLGCLQKYRDWIMMPRWVTFEISNDGQNFTEVKKIQNEVSIDEQSPTIKDFVADFSARKARFIRVTAKVLDALPKGHVGEGKPAWLFADEIIVD